MDGTELTTWTQTIAAQLGETEPWPLWQISRALEVAGLETVQGLVQSALEVEAQGGQPAVDGGRPRTRGGIFFGLLRQRLDPSVFRKITKAALLKTPADGASASRSIVAALPTKAARKTTIRPEPIHPIADPDQIAAIAGGRHPSPADFLGLHSLEPEGGTHRGFVVRTFQPEAQSVAVKVGRRKGRAKPMRRIHAEGVFEAVFPRAAHAFNYRLQVTLPGGRVDIVEDPYRFGPVLSPADLSLLTEGRHYRLYTTLGAQVIRHGGVWGVAFAVWAPNAERVSVIGDFNEWDGRRHPMRARREAGVWEIFVPGLAQGELYKFEIKTRAQGYVAVKADPMGFRTELRPQTASIVWNLRGYTWHDQTWMAARRARQAPTAPLSVYEVHLGSWRRKADPEYGRRWLTYRELAEELVPYAKDMGFTHLELLPVTEHPLDGSWGYQTVGYYAPTARFGTPDDFRYFVDQAHQAGLGVILDWVPAHFPKDSHGLGYFDGTHLYEHADPRQGEHPDWGTLIFNFGRREVVAFLLSNALYWLDQYHIDGLRVDAVTSMLYLDYSRRPGQWIPNRYGGRENLDAVAFLKQFNDLVHAQHPGVLTFAEEATNWPNVSRPTAAGGLGFDLKWNMGWMHDSLDYVHQDPSQRRRFQNKLTFSLTYAFSEDFLLAFSHDEVVHAKGSLFNKMPGNAWQKLANLRALFAYLYAQPGKKLLFMGDEFGQAKEWDFAGELDWGLLDSEGHRQLRECVRDLNRLYRSQPALHEVDFSWDGFQWIDFKDGDHSVISFLRRARDPSVCVVVVANFGPAPQRNYRVGVPASGFYRELFNSDAARYGGSNVGNAGGRAAEPMPWQGQPFSLLLTLPALSVLFLQAARPGALSQPE